jgi:hypothetical protein
MVLSTKNSGKYLSRTWERDKNAGEWDSSNLTAEEISFLEIQDGEGRIKYEAEQLRRKTDGLDDDNLLHLC